MDRPRPATRLATASVLPLSLAAALAAVAAPAALAQAEPQKGGNAVTILERFSPRILGGPGVPIETPPRNTWEDCTWQALEPDTDGESGYLVNGPGGQPLRKVLDENRDGNVNLFIFYNNGVEVYREWDDRKDRKSPGGQALVEVNNFRWVNFGGTAWGVDADGRAFDANGGANSDPRKKFFSVDQWKRLAPAEAGRIAAEALIENSPAKLATVLVNQGDLRELRVAGSIAKDVLEKLDGPREIIRSVRGAAPAVADAKFLQYTSGQPGLIPTTGDRGGKELLVEESGSIVLELPRRQTLLMAVGEMVEVGDVWKLVTAPTPITEDGGGVVLGGPLMLPEGGGPLPPQPLNEEMRKLLVELQQLTSNPPKQSATAAEKRNFSAKKLRLLAALYKADDSETRGEWLVQQADEWNLLDREDLVQTEDADQNFAKLRQVADSGAKSALPPLDQRILFREYLKRSGDLGGGDGNPDPKVADRFEQWWKDARLDFVKTYPDADETARFLYSLALQAESESDPRAAKNYYQTLVARFPNSDTGRMSAGALRRIDLVGKPLDLSVRTLAGSNVSAEDLRGKAVLLAFWRTDSQPWNNDLPLLKDLKDKYADNFEIVAVNLDADRGEVEKYVARERLNFPVGYDLQNGRSPLVERFGVGDLPTLILTDRRGRVVDNKLTIREAREKVTELMR